MTYKPERLTEPEAISLAAPMPWSSAEGFISNVGLGLIEIEMGTWFFSSVPAINLEF